VTHVIVLPGGGYWTLIENEGEPVADWVRSATGLDASVFRYPLNRPHPEPLLAVRERVVELRHEGVETIGLIGFSAGGHLAGQAALAPSSDPAERIDFAVLGYPVTSMELDTYKPSQDILLGTNPTAAARRHTSLEYLVTAQAPPLFLWHTAEDVNVPAVHVFPHGPHLLGLAEGIPDVEKWTHFAARWIIEYAHFNGTDQQSPEGRRRR
jgi:acetyl esterase/lipase